MLHKIKLCHHTPSKSTKIQNFIKKKRGSPVVTKIHNTVENKITGTRHCQVIKAG